MAVGDVFKMRLQWFQPTTLQTAENTLFFERATGVLIFDTEEEDLTQAFLEQALVAYQQCIHSNYELQRILIAPMPAGITSFEYAPSGIIGGQGGDQLDPVSAGGLSFKSAHLGRRGRSKIALGPVAESVNTALGRPSGTEIGILEEFATGLLNMNCLVCTTTAPWLWTVWSNADQASYPVVSYKGSPIWYTQRSRKR